MCRGIETGAGSIGASVRSLNIWVFLPCYAELPGHTLEERSDGINASRKSKS